MTSLAGLARMAAGAEGAVNGAGLLETLQAEGSGPGPRCGHTLTALPVSEHDPVSEVIAFGGATELENPSGKAGSVRLTGACASAHRLRVRTGQWELVETDNAPPEPRAAHAAAGVGEMLVVHGGIAQNGFADANLHVLDLSSATSRPQWHTIPASGEPPGPRYGHSLTLVHHRYLISYGGFDGSDVLGDVHALDTASKPYEWVRICPPENGPPARMYHSACTRANDGLMLVSGGRSTSTTGSQAFSDIFGLTRHRDGTWEWIYAPFSCPSPRYQHASAAVGNLLYVVGGASTGGNHLVDGTELVAYDTAQQGNAHWATPQRPGDCEYAKRSRHAAAGSDSLMIVHGGLYVTNLLDDTLVCFDPRFDGKELVTSVELDAMPWRKLVASAGLQTPLPSNHLTFPSAPETTYDHSQTYAGTAAATATGASLGRDSHGNATYDAADAVAAASAATELATNGSPNRAQLEEAAAQEARAAKEAMGLMRTQVGNGCGDSTHSKQRRLKSRSLNGSSAREINSPEARAVRLYHRAVVATYEMPTGAESDTVLGARSAQLSRQESIDRLQHEARRVNVDNKEDRWHHLRRVSSAQGAAHLARAELLQPDTWTPESDGSFPLGIEAIEELCQHAQDVFSCEETLIRLHAPLKVFGDIHGQFTELMQLFKHFGIPSTAGDITYIDYLFLGDYVDRGTHSLEVICLLFALKCEQPWSVHLIRGNHEADEINAHFGFKEECVRRLGQRGGERVWNKINEVFDWMPLAALIDDRILCLHGGLGRNISSLQQIESIARPLRMSESEKEIWDILWSDPTPNDGVEGVQPSQRGPGLVAFGPDRVQEFCNATGVQLIIRAHECVMDGFERFAGGKLLTVFSAANYCGTARNSGALLVIGRDLTVVPKLLMTSEYQDAGRLMHAA